MSKDDKFTPESLTAPEYIRALFEPGDNAAILVRNRATGKTVQRIAGAETIASTEFQEWLAAQSAAGADVYVSMNPIREGAYSRTKDNIKDIRHAYLDLDRNGDTSLEAISNSRAVPPPNFVLDTSPGKHQVVWRVTGFNPEEAEALLRNLANQFDGDSAATDATRVLRLPGFPNRKLSEEFIVQARYEGNAVYSPRDFALQDGSLETPRRIAEGQEHPRTMPTNHRSQSEQDWAFAKRALARGDDPQEIIRRIADYRGDEKSDPGYYAHRTVARALEDLQKDRDHPNPIEQDRPDVTQREVP